MAERGVICVEVAGSAYGIPVAEVQEVIGYRAPTRVFHAPSALAGVTNLRGDVLPIIDLSSLFDAPAASQAQAAESRVVVVRELGGARRRAGLKVDVLLGLRALPAGGTEEVPAAIAQRLGGLLLGMVSEAPAFAVLSVTGIFNAPAFRELLGAVVE